MVKKPSECVRRLDLVDAENAIKNNEFDFDDILHFQNLIQEKILQHLDKKYMEKDNLPF